MKLLEGRNTILWIFAQSKGRKCSDEGGDPRAVEILSDLADAAAVASARESLAVRGASQPRPPSAWRTARPTFGHRE